MLYRLLSLIVLCAMASANAQTTYRWIDEGKTVYSDQPPPPGAKNPTLLPDSPPPLEEKTRPDLAGLPYALRIAAENYPVTLYTAASCGYFCDEARALLKMRRIPYTEILLDKLPENELKQALDKLRGDTPYLPVLMVGSQRKEGIEKGAWNDLFDLAGYPQDLSYIKPPLPHILPPPSPAPPPDSPDAAASPKEGMGVETPLAPPP